jgi:hypothetical protein
MDKVHELVEKTMIKAQRTGDNLGKDIKDLGFLDDENLDRIKEERVRQYNTVKECIEVLEILREQREESCS